MVAGLMAGFLVDSAVGFLVGYRGALTAAASVFVAVMAPGECRLCALPLAEAGPFPVCGVCVAGLRGSPYAGCARCGEALAMESARAAGLARTDASQCDACRDEAPPFARATAFGDYGGGLRALIHLHKFEGVRALAEPLGARLAEAMERACEGTHGTVHVVAVPLYRSLLRKKRAFNQSAELADVAVRQVHVAGAELVCAHGLLRRTRATESQVHLTPEKRRENVRGAFAVAGDVRGKQVLLVDDVYTTGATAMECTRVLLRAGAASVRVATLARTQRALATGWDAGWTGVAAVGV